MRQQIKHEEHRLMIAQIVIDLIVKFGLDGVTIRQVAASAGLSTTAVTHYFANKKDLLLFAYQTISRGSYSRIDEALRKDPTDLYGFLEALAYVDHPEYWKVYIAFWQIAMIDADFRAEQDARNKDAQRMLVELLVRRLAPDISGNTDILGQTARNLILAVQGLGIQGVLHEGDWPVNDKHKFLEAQADIAVELARGTIL